MVRESLMRRMQSVFRDALVDGSKSACGGGKVSLGKWGTAWRDGG